MNLKVFIGGLIAFIYNRIVGGLPIRSLRRAYLAAWLGKMGDGTSVQMGCRFLNGRKVHFGERNVINFGCLFDGRKYHICIGSDVSIGPEASILTLGHDPQSPDFADRGGDVIEPLYVRKNAIRSSQGFCGRGRFGQNFRGDHCVGQSAL